MNKIYENVPILLIGLGGIGSEIVDNVYGRLKENNNINNVEAIVFDTDVNSQKNLKNISCECKIQTSTDKTVKYALENDKTAYTWFPTHPLIEKVGMLNGAGQIRAISRLALRQAMKEGKLTTLSAVKERLFKLGSGINEKGLRVMIVSSMMGGTGSGIFLQIPLYIRELFESEITGSTDRIEIQGTFILPDVLKGAISPKETENIYSNAYAAMKELNAIIASLGGDGNNVNLEYKPNQLNAEGMRDITIKSWPYDYCYFYDKEDTKGRVLGSFKDYINMIENNLYTSIYGPISDRMYSIYCNEIKNIVSKGGRNIYGGIGVGELTYPYQDIANYCTYRIINDSLNNQLLKIDNIYKKELAIYNQNIQNGIDDIMPNLEEIYITNFESLSTTDNFFSKIKRQLTEYDINGNEVTDNIKKLNNNIDNEILSIATNDEEIKNLSISSFLKSGTLTNLPHEKLRSIVNNYENNFKEYRLFIEGKTKNKAEALANANFGIYSEFDKSILNDYLVNKDIFINSVGVRYLLYKLNRNLKQEKINLEKSLKELRNQLEYAENKAFSNQNTNIDASKKVNLVIRNKGIFNINISKFKEEYETIANKHYKLLDMYCKSNLKYHYYNRTIELLEALILEYENMFIRLEEQKTEVEKKISILSTKHNDTTGTTNHYVLASSANKEQILNSIPEEVKTNILSETLSEEIHKALFNGFKNKINNIDFKTNYDELFHKLIVKNCYNTLLSNNNIKELLDINIMEALDKEALYMNVTNKEEHIKSRLSKLIDSVSPWTPKSTDSSDINLFGISTKSRTITESVDEKSRLEKLIDEISTSKLIANNIVSNKELSDKSIYFTAARYGLMVNDFPKFQAGKNNTPDGEYYLAYKNVIDKITEYDKKNIYGGTAITPHIDKRWHLTLRDINDSVYKNNLKNIAKAFIIGIINQNFIATTSEINPDITQFVSRFDDIPTSINILGTSIDGKIKNLYKALSRNPDLVRNALEEFDKYCDIAINNAARDINILDTSIIKKLNNVSICGYEEITNVIDVFISLDRESTKAEKEDKKYKEKYKLLYTALFEIIEEFIKPYCFGQDDIDFKNKYNKVLKSLISTSTWNNTLSKDSIVYVESLGQLKNKIESI